MERIADDVHRLILSPKDGINAYLVGDVLVDAGTRFSVKKILAELSGHSVTAHALTHAHADHAGGTKGVAGQLNLPVWVGERDASAMETGKPEVTKSFLQPLAGFPKHPVARRLKEGDDFAAGFTVLETPGHSPGHVSFWRESDRTLILGDVFFNLHPATLKPGLRPPIALFTIDVPENRRQMERLAALEPAITLFGHGPPHRGALTV